MTDDDWKDEWKDDESEWDTTGEEWTAMPAELPTEPVSEPEPEPPTKKHRVRLALTTALSPTLVANVLDWISVFETAQLAGISRAMSVAVSKSLGARTAWIGAEAKNGGRTIEAVRIAKQVTSVKDLYEDMVLRYPEATTLVIEAPTHCNTDLSWVDHYWPRVHTLVLVWPVHVRDPKPAFYTLPLRVLRIEARANDVLKTIASGAFPRLQRLDMNLTECSGSDAITIVENHPSLVSLALGDVLFYASQGPATFLRRCNPKMHRLWFGGSGKLDLDDVKPLTQLKCMRIFRMSLSLTAKQLGAAMMAWHETLEEISVGEVKDESLLAGIVHLCPNLRRLEPMLKWPPSGRQPLVAYPIHHLVDFLEHHPQFPSAESILATYPSSIASLKVRLDVSLVMRWSGQDTMALALLPKVETLHVTRMFDVDLVWSYLVSVTATFPRFQLYTNLWPTAFKHKATRSLKHLTLRTDDEIDPARVARVARLFPQLEHLEVYAGVGQIVTTTRKREAIDQQLSKLSLHLSAGPVDTDLVLDLLTCCARLRTIMFYVSGASTVSLDDFFGLEISRPGTRIEIHGHKVMFHQEVLDELLARTGIRLIEA